MGSTGDSAASAVASRKRAPRARTAGPECRNIENHGELWQAISDMRADLAEVKGRVSVILMGVGAIFASIVGLLIAQVA